MYTHEYIILTLDHQRWTLE